MQREVSGRASEAGTLKGATWNDFRRTECGSAAAGASGEPKPTLASATEPKAPAAPNAPKDVVFPQSVDKKFAKESPGRARMHTCLEQYKIDKKNNALGGLRWMHKGGGYYSLCNARLKG